MSRARLLLAALAAAALIVPATASAERTVTYRVTVEGEGTYVHDATTPSGAVHYDARWTWATEFPPMRFVGDRPVYDDPATTPAITSAFLLSGDATRVMGADVFQCTPTHVSDVNTGRFLEDDGMVPTPEPMVGMRLLGGVFPAFEGCPHQAAASFAVAGAVWNEVHTFDTWFTVPRETIGMGRIIQLLHEDVTGRRCPNNATGTADCRLSYDATVTFEKIDDTGGPAGDPGTPPVPTPAPAVPKPAPVPLAPDATVVRPVGAGLGASAAQAAFTVSCPAACSGTATATLPRARRATASRTAVLARQRFSAPAGKAKRIVVRFSRAARKRIVRAGAVALRVRTVAAGRADEQVLTLKLGAGTTKGVRPISGGRG